MFGGETLNGTRKNYNRNGIDTRKYNIPPERGQAQGRVQSGQRHRPFRLTSDVRGRARAGERSWGWGLLLWVRVGVRV